jgi:hypothetical protein
VGARAFKRGVHLSGSSSNLTMTMFFIPWDNARLGTCSEIANV